MLVSIYASKLKYGGLTYLFVMGMWYEDSYSNLEHMDHCNICIDECLL